LSLQRRYNFAMRNFSFAFLWTL